MGAEIGGGAVPDPACSWQSRLLPTAGPGAPHRNHPLRSSVFTTTGSHLTEVVMFPVLQMGRLSIVLAFAAAISACTAFEGRQDVAVYQAWQPVTAPLPDGPRL
jgi:hypothetical protein